MNSLLKNITIFWVLSMGSKMALNAGNQSTVQPIDYHQFCTTDYRRIEDHMHLFNDAQQLKKHLREKQMAKTMQENNERYESLSLEYLELVTCLKYYIQKRKRVGAKLEIIHKELLSSY
jgi:hypothetical protein